MQPQENELDVLVRRVREGDYQAKDQLPEQMGPGMVTVLRRALREGTPRNSVERKVLAAARHFYPAGFPSPDDPRTAPLARDICQLMVDSMWPGQTIEAWAETIPA